MPADRLVKLPDGISDRDAATLMLKGLTVQYLFRQTYKLKAGETILFHAAAGGVGPHRVPVGARARRHDDRHRRRRDEKAALAKANGCTHTIVYTRENFVERVKELTGGKGVPVVYDGVGKDTFPASLDCLSPRGLFVLFGNASGPVPPFDMQLARAEGLALRDAADALHLRGDARQTCSRWRTRCSSWCSRARSRPRRARRFRSRRRPTRIARCRRARRPARRC